jgi:PKD repeat protein
VGPDGDGAFDDGAAATASFTYSQPGTYTAALRVTNPSGASSTDSTGVASGSFVAPDHEYPSHLELRLTATDSGGLTHTTNRQLDPQTVDLSFGSNPAGLTLAVGSTSQPAPFIRSAIMGSTLSVSAPSPQATGGTAYEFVSWLDGGAQTHSIVANATYRVRLGGPAISQVAARPAP